MNRNPKILDDVRVIQKCFVLDNDGNLLALRRDLNDHSRSGAWDLPGGGYENGEDVVEAIKREVMEEAGLTAQKLYPVYFANKIGIKMGLFAGKNVFVVCYICRDWEGEVTLSDEHIEYKWVTPQEFMKLDFAQDDGFFADAVKAYLDSIE